MIVLLKFIVLVHVGNGARILGIVPTPAYSHNIVFRPLWRELSLRGHHVTTITTHPIGDPNLSNLTEIDLGEIHLPFNEFLEEVAKDERPDVYTELTRYYSRMGFVLDKYLGHPSVHEMIKDPRVEFDLVIGEYFYGSLFAFATRFGCPSIGMLSCEALNPIYEAVGNPVHPSAYPDPLLSVGTPMSLMERLMSFVTLLKATYATRRGQSTQQELVEKHFGRQYPPVRELWRNVSLLFVNADPIFHPIRPLVPGVVQIGAGSHRSPAEPLPSRWQRTLDAASNGFVYFSMGSNVKSEYLPKGLIDLILETFAELPLTVVWKFESDTLESLPENVIVSKWLPQQDILRHPNIKLFITQGGLQSMDEAIYAHVPMIGIPFYGDQPYNVRRMASKGIGLELDHRTLDKEKLKAAILEVANNPKYRNTLKRLAELAQDQPMTGIEKAVWWTEYVIHHSGAKHLRSPLLDIPWYQYLLLDVIGVLLLAVLLILYVVYLIIRIVRSVLCKPFVNN
ncbi:UDP-glucuronosyltransferase 2B33-like [Photinus pyralis]|nr:UDP-glucuronosyltransferase 2B33-like [Photinus pyralis]